MTPHLNRLDETVLTMGHKICFYGIIWIIISKLSLLPLLIWSTEMLMKWKTKDYQTASAVYITGISILSCPIPSHPSINPSSLSVCLSIHFFPNYFSVSASYLLNHVKIFSNLESDVHLVKISSRTGIFYSFW